MLKKIIFCVFLLSYNSSAYAMKEGPIGREQYRYLVILQKAYQGDPKSINGLHNALRKLKERSHPDDYKNKLSQFCNQALSPEISSETFAGHIKNFIEHEKRRICASPLTDFDNSFHRSLLASLTEQQRGQIRQFKEEVERWPGGDSEF
ncbi:MAG: hypothetical protein K2X28_08845 [Alphaproteobacteria bacterium]|nr:hypothetical protein [Alphaproteobacteria bacterium]